MARHDSPNGSRAAKAVGYLRRSTDRQEQSIGDQKKSVEQYASEHGLKLIDFYIDDAISGTSTLGRKAFQKLIEDAQKPHCPFSIVVVYDVKRFGRVDNDEAGYYRHLLRMHGVEVKYVSENFTGDTTDDLLRPVKQWQARQESKDLSKVTIRGLLSKADGGWWMGGCAPYGYDLRYESSEGKFLFILRHLPDGTKQLLNNNGKVERTLARGESLSTSKRDRAKLMPSSPDRVKVIKMIFRMYCQEGKGYKAIADTLNRQKVATPRGPAWSHIYSGHWTDTTIRAILVNPIYGGDMVWNRRTDAKFHKISEGRAVERDTIHGHRLVPNNQSDWVIVQDTHPALVDRRTVEAVRKRLDSTPTSIEQRGMSPRARTNGKTWSGQRSRFILSGLLKCALCGSRYQGFTRIKGQKRWDHTRVKSYAYGCGGYIQKGTSVCQMNPIPQELLESTVIDAVLGFYEPYLQAGGRKKLSEVVRKQLGGQSEDVAAAAQRVKEEMKDLDGVIENLLDNITPTNRQFVDSRPLFGTAVQA